MKSFFIDITCERCALLVPLAGIIGFSEGSELEQTVSSTILIFYIALLIIFIALFQPKHDAAKATHREKLFLVAYFILAAISHWLIPLLGIAVGDWRYNVAMISLMVAVLLYFTTKHRQP